MGEGNSVAPSRPYNFRPSSFTSHKSNSTAREKLILTQHSLQSRCVPLTISTIMSYLSRSLTPLRATGRAFPSRSVAAFHISSARRGLNEENIHREDRDKHIEHHKSDSLKKAKTAKESGSPSSEATVN